MVRHLVLKLLLASAAVTSLSAQTKLDLQHQARGIDFTGDTYTKPARTGASLPGTCNTAEMFILTSGPVGSNFYLCLAPNQWAVQGGSGSGGSGSSGTPNALSSSVSGPTLTIGSSCSPASPCNVRVGSTVYTFVAPANASLSGGTGTAYVYVSSSGILTVGHNLTLTCTSGCTAVTGITGFPAGSVPLASWTSSNGTWGAGSDLRALLAIDNYNAGTGLQATNGANSTQFNIDPSVVLERGVISGTGATLCTDASGNATTTGCSTGSGGGSGSGLGDPGSNGIVKRTAVNTTGIASATDIESSLGFTPENVTNKGAANGYAPLNASSQVPGTNLPVASSTTAGVVKVDGTSITINGTGVISATGGSGGGGSSYGSPTTTLPALNASSYSLIINENSLGSVVTNTDGSVVLMQNDSGTTQNWAYYGTPVTGSSAFTKTYFVKFLGVGSSYVEAGLCSWTGAKSPGQFAFMGIFSSSVTGGHQLNTTGLTTTTTSGGIAVEADDFSINDTMVENGVGIYLKWTHTPTTSPYDYLSMSLDGVNWRPMTFISGTWINSSTFSNAITSTGVCIANQIGQAYAGGGVYVPGTHPAMIQIYGVQ